MKAIVAASLILIMTSLVSAQSTAPVRYETSPEITPQTIEEVKAVVIKFGTAWDTHDVATAEGLLAGDPALVQMKLSAIDREDAKRKANNLAREKLLTSDSSNKPQVGLPLTNYLRKIMDEEAVFVGNNQQVQIRRKEVGILELELKKTADGWRITPNPEELRGLSAEELRAMIQKETELYTQLNQRLEKNEFKSWDEYSAATLEIRQQLRPRRGPTTFSTTQPTR